MKASLLLEKLEKEFEENSYDSTGDTVKHQEIVKKSIGKFIDFLKERGEHHDESKLEEPEKSGYDKTIPLLKKTKYGTEEYNKIRSEAKCFEQHFANNRHHPEHFKNGINGMNLVDIVEMVLDWYSASQRSDTPFSKGIEKNIEQFGIEPQLADILRNTAKIL